MSSKAKENKLQVGDLVMSTAGHDRSNVFAVMWVDGLYVGICDGKHRKLDKIKTKKILHVQKVGHSEMLAEAVKSCKTLLDSDVRKHCLERVR